MPADGDEVERPPMKTSKLLCLLSLGISAALGGACSSGSESSSGGSDAGNDSSMGGNDATNGDVNNQNDTGGGMDGGGATCNTPEDCTSPNVCCGSFGGTAAGTCGPSPCTMGSQLCDGTHACPTGEQCRYSGDGGTLGRCRAPHDGGFGEGGFPHEDGGDGGGEDGGDGGLDGTTGD